MVADGHVLVVRQQRVVRAEHLADIGGVVDADVKVGVVADPRRQVQRARVGRVQVGLDLGPLGAAFREQLREPRPQRLARAGAEGEERVQRAAGRGLGGAGRFAGEQPGGVRGGKIEHHVPDRDAGPRRPGARAARRRRAAGSGSGSRGGPWPCPPSSRASGRASCRFAPCPWSPLAPRRVEVLAELRPVIPAPGDQFGLVGLGHQWKLVCGSRVAASSRRQRSAMTAVSSSSEATCRLTIGSSTSDQRRSAGWSSGL